MIGWQKTAYHSFFLSSGLGDSSKIIILLSGIVLVSILMVLLINIRKRTKAQKEALDAKKRLEENYVELENAYEKVKNTKKELSVKYEELKRSEERNKKLAFTDYLTGLPNRTAFTEKLDQVTATLRKEENIGVMYVDLDNFKNVNDSLGHSYGDELLIDVTERLKQTVDENDYLARFGGDEFLLLTQNIEDLGLYEEKIKKVRKVFSYPFVLAMQEFFVTVSIGISFAPKDGKTTQAIIKNVDSAMYAAKDLGKNTYCFYDESINQHLMERIEMQSELRNAMDHNEIAISYQPVTDLKTGNITGFEALLRWDHPIKGLILPEQFLALAEDTGLIVPIGEQVLLEVCRRIKYWDEQGYQNITMAVNLSARQLKDPKFINMLEDAVLTTGADPSRLELQITESVALQDLNDVLGIMAKLEEMGLRLSLDNFGTAYCSLNLLKYLPINNLKIDANFLDRAMKNKNDKFLITTIIKLAKDMGFTVIAKGVEDGQQARFLQESQCDLAQGSFYSIPLSQKEADSYLSAFGKDPALLD